MVRRIYNVSNKPAEPRTPQRHDHGGQPAEHIHDTIQMACDCDDRMRAMEARIAELEARPVGREVVKVESTAVERLPQTMINEWEAFKRDLARFKESQEFVLPQAFAEMVERVTRLEALPRDITPGSTDTTVVERLTAVEGSVSDLQDNREAFREMIEAGMKFSRLAHELMQQIDANRARSDGQHGMAMDAVLDLSRTIRRAIG